MNFIANLSRSQSRYDCKPENEFNDMCIENASGKYKSKESCINDCEGIYIYRNLTKAGIHIEANIYYKFIKELINLGLDVYLKGGNPLGIKVMRMISDKYQDKGTFSDYFDKFLDLGLIKDWDFHCYTYSEITAVHKEKLDKLAKKFKLVSKGKKFILYQTRKPIEILDTALFEVSIWDKDNYSDLESVMSTMKIRVTEHNLKYIFMFAKSFYSYVTSNDKKTIDVDVIYRMITKLDVIVYPHSYGFFIVNSKEFNDGGLGKGMLNMIKTFINNHKLNKNIEQFLIAHIKEPKRMYFRLLEKNIPKAHKIYSFLINAKLVVSVPGWLIDSDKMLNIIELFTNELRDRINIEYDKTGIDGVMIFLKNVNFKPIKDEFARFSKQGISYVISLLDDL